MNIVSGRFRHRKLHTNPGLITRPITARVKVSLFDYIQPWLDDQRIADIYSGTGTMGLEALSRGARSVVFFEQDKVAFELLKKNVEELKVEDETLCWKVDVTKCSFRPRGGDALRPFDLMFFDPPYFHVEKMTVGSMMYKSLLRLAKPEISAPTARLLFRVEQKTEYMMPPVWEREELLKYSSMEIGVYRKRGAPPDEETLEETLDDTTADNTETTDED